MSIRELLKEIQAQLNPVSDTPKLDAELLLMHSLQKSRTYLYTYSKTILTDKQSSILERILHRRLQGEPIAYILGYKEFWSLPIEITHDTLIPRPETEHLVEWALHHLSKKEKLDVADLGTGSGAIALALAKERPNWKITATEKSIKAIIVAQHNAKQKKKKNIGFYLNQGDHWCDGLPHSHYAAIISNPPYIAENDKILADFVLQYEPHSALIAKQQGLAELIKIIIEATHYLLPGGWLILEHGYNQANSVQDLMQHENYQAIQTHRDLAGHQRFTVGHTRNDI